MSKFDLISDVSTMTTTADKTLRKLFDKGIECICHNVLESINESDIETTIDISIGEIKIIVDKDEIHYRFSPSKKLESMLIESVLTRKDPLISDIEDKLYSRIMNTYKDLV